MLYLKMLALLHAVVPVDALARGDARWSTLDEHSFRHAGFNWFPILTMLAFMFVMCAKDKKEKMQKAPGPPAAAGVYNPGTYTPAGAASAAEPAPERYELLPEAEPTGLEVRDGRQCMAYDTKGRNVDSRTNPIMSSSTAVEWNFKVQNQSMDADTDNSPRRPLGVETTSTGADATKPSSPKNKKRDKDQTTEDTPHPKSGKKSKQRSRSPQPSSPSSGASSPASGKSRSRAASRAGSRTPKKQRTEKKM